MKLLSSFVIFNLLCSSRPSKIVSTKRSAPVCVGQQFQSNRKILARTLEWSTTPKNLHLAWVHPVLYHQDSVRFGSFQLHCSWHAAHHQLHCFVQLLAAFTMRRRDPPGVIFKRVSVAVRAHHSICFFSLCSVFFFVLMAVLLCSSSTSVLSHLPKCLFPRLPFQPASGRSHLPILCAFNPTPTVLKTAVHTNLPLVTSAVSPLQARPS